MNLDSFYQRYATLVLMHSLKIKKDDVLSINTEEDDYSFARILSQKAKLITGNGSYIQIVKNGRVIDNFDIYSDFPLKKQPTAFIYIPLFKSFDNVDFSSSYEAKDLQRFNLLSDPLDNPIPSVSFVTCPIPSSNWDEALDKYDEASSLSLLDSIFSLSSSDYLEEHKLRESNLLYIKNELDKLKLSKVRVVNDEGTDLTFSFLPSSSFKTSRLETTFGRSFNPSIISNDIFRLLDPNSINGYLNISKPIVLWGKKISNLSLFFKEGKVVEIRGNRQSESLFAFYLRQDENAGRASMLTICELESPLSQVEIILNKEYDRMRSVSITIGGPKAEAVTQDVTNTVDSIASLSLPIESESLVINALDNDGEEIEIYNSGFFTFLYD